MITPYKALFIWSAIFCSVLITAFYQLYALINSSIPANELSIVTMAIGGVVTVVFLVVLFYGIVPVVKQLFLEKKLLQLHAHEDPLTQLYNRRGFIIAFEREIKLQNRNTSSVASLVLMDLDDFKLVNDNFGHDSGDLVLQGVANTIKTTIRSTDIAGRFGGEEFILLLPNTGLRSANILCEKVRSAIKLSSNHYVINKNVPVITVSMGIITLSSQTSFIEHISKVDQLLYKAKDSGKDCIKIDSSQPIL